MTDLYVDSASILCHLAREVLFAVTGVRLLGVKSTANLTANLREVNRFTETD